MFRTRRAPLLAAGLMLSATLAACGGSSSGGTDGGHSSVDPGATETATSGTPTVTIEGFAFHPANLVISKGMTVKFVQEDTTMHNVVGEGASSFIHSPLMGKGQSYTVTFSKTGTYDYICTIHSNMHGKVIVQ